MTETIGRPVEHMGHQSLAKMCSLEYGTFCILIACKESVSCSMIITSHISHWICIGWFLRLDMVTFSIVMIVIVLFFISV